MYFDKRSITKIIGIALLYSVYLVFSLTFIYAYFNQNKEVLVLINQYGEADSEMFLLVAVGVLGTYVLFTEFRTVPEEIIQRKDLLIQPKAIIEENSKI